MLYRFERVVSELVLIYTIWMFAEPQADGHPLGGSFKHLKEEHMLYSVEDNTIINYIPHSHDYHIWRNRLTVAEYDAIVDEKKFRHPRDP